MIIFVINAGDPDGKIGKLLIDGVRELLELQPLVRRCFLQQGNGLIQRSETGAFGHGCCRAMKVTP